MKTLGFQTFLSNPEAEPRGILIIKNQEEHHTKKTFQQEYVEFIEKYSFKKFKDE